MARFKTTVSGAAPLRIQLSTSSTCPAEVVEVSAGGENTSGSASYPTLSRPSTPGSGTGVVLPLDPGSSSTCTAVTTFTVAPTTPSVSSGSFNLPLRMFWLFPPGMGLIVPILSHVLLFADATAGHTWSGELTWREG